MYPTQSNIAIRINNVNVNKADTWWRTMCANPLLRMIAQGKLTSHYISSNRKASTLTAQEIYDIYMRETPLER